LAKNAAPFESLTKLQAAERQLRVAIRLFFERRDLVAVHTLAAAAQEVLRDLGRPRGIKSIFKDSDLIRPEHREEVANRLNEAQNFLKHADRDPDKQLQFWYEATQFYLLDAALLYYRLTDQQFPEITGLLAWFAVKFPNFLVEGAFKQQIMDLVPPQGFNPDNYQLLLAAIDLLAQGSAGS
jgi:hypothetical protein